MSQVVALLSGDRRTKAMVKGAIRSSGVRFLFYKTFLAVIPTCRRGTLRIIFVLNQYSLQHFTAVSVA